MLPRHKSCDEVQLAAQRRGPRVDTANVKSFLDDAIEKNAHQAKAPRAARQGVECCDIGLKRREPSRSRKRLRLHPLLGALPRRIDFACVWKQRIRCAGASYIERDDGSG